MVEPFISVIIPVYNVEKYLIRCVESILTQTYQNTEVVLIDDGSKDNSGEICDALSRKYKKVRTVHKVNAGLGMARNTGIDNARGDYIVFIDSDDWCDSTLLEHLLEYRNKYDCDTVLSGLKRVDKNGNVKRIENEYEEIHYAGEVIKKTLLPRIIGRLPEKRDSIGVSSCACLYSMKIIKKYNLRFVSERDFLSEDLLFKIDYILCSESICIAPIYEYNYFMNSGTLSTKYREGVREKYNALYKILRSKLVDAGVFDDEMNIRLSTHFFVKIKGCIRQESKKVSKFPMKKSIKNIRDVCEDSLCVDLFKGYPITRMGFERFLFLFAVKHKMACALYLSTFFM